MADRLNNGWFSENAGPRGAKGLYWRGIWSSVAKYKRDDIVSYNGTIYISTFLNQYKEPESNPTFWKVFLETFKWSGTWGSTLTYAVNDVVEYMGSTYIAIASSTNILPTNTSYWNLMAAGGSGGSGPSQSAIVAGTNMNITSGAINLDNDINVSQVALSSGALSNIMTPESTSLDQVLNSDNYVSTVTAGSMVAAKNANTIVLDAQTGNYPALRFMDNVNLSNASCISQTTLPSQIEGGATDFIISNTVYDNSGAIQTDVPILKMRESPQMPRLTVPGITDFNPDFMFTRLVVSDDAGNLVAVNKGQWEPTGLPLANADGQIMISDGSSATYVPVTPQGINGIVVSSSGSAAQPIFTISVDPTQSLIANGLSVNNTSNTINLSNDIGYAFVRGASSNTNVLWSLFIEDNISYSADFVAICKTVDGNGNPAGTYIVKQTYLIENLGNTIDVVGVFSITDSTVRGSHSDPTVTASVSGTTVTFTANLSGQWSTKIDILRATMP